MAACGHGQAREWLECLPAFVAQPAVQDHISCVGLQVGDTASSGPSAGQHNQPGRPEMCDQQEAGLAVAPVLHEAPASSLQPGPSMAQMPEANPIPTPVLPPAVCMAAEDSTWLQDKIAAALQVPT